jgi:DNA invertase Pin-like site-specific DNA recombinase
MFHNRISLVDILLEEVVMYLRKSRSDDPALTVQEVLRNHEKELDDWCERNLGGTIDEKRKYKEIVSGEKMAERPELQKILKELERPDIKYLITNEPQRLSRGYLDEIGKLVLLLRHNHITVITPTKIYNMEDEYDRELFERELKRGNEYLEYFKKIQKRGKDRKVADGEYIGNIVPYGYKKKQYKEGKRTIKTLEVVPELYIDGYTEGYSENYIRVYIRGEIEKTPTRVRVEDIYKDGVVAVKI